METYKYYAGGRWLSPLSGDHIESEDPYLAEPWAKIPRCQAEDVDNVVRAAHDAFATGPWGRMSATDRGKLIRRLGEAMAAHADRLAEIETRDNGKRVVDILPGLTGGLVETFEYYAGIADKLQGAVIPTGQSGIFNYTKHEPYGVVACITAWNSPLLIATWKIAPALAAGNTVVLKPSEFASASTLELMKAFEDVDLPPGVLNVVTGYGDEAGEALVNHPLVRKVSFTGSLQGGCKVAKIAARTVKSVTMELGGKSPQIVFADADLDAAVKGVVGGIFPPAGQSCIAGSRLLVEARVHDEVLDRIAQMARKARLGPPSDPRTH
ncbi:MAG: aldehyde dehydrogenase family protein, partial [Hyphomicrobiaceae bacterium]